MGKKNSTTTSSPGERGLNSDEQKRRTNRPKQVFPDGTNGKDQDKPEKSDRKKVN